MVKSLTCHTEDPGSNRGLGSFSCKYIALTFGSTDQNDMNLDVESGVKHQYNKQTPNL